MAEKPKKPAAAAPPMRSDAPAPPGSPTGAAIAPATPAVELSWRTSWQFPALIGAVMLLIGGIGWGDSTG